MLLSTNDKVNAQPHSTQSTHSGGMTAIGEVEKTGTSTRNNKGAQ